MEVFLIILSVLVNRVDWDVQLLEHFKSATDEVRVERPLMRVEDVNCGVYILLEFFKDF